MDAETLIRPVVEGANLELVEVTFSREAGRRILRVVVDRDGGIAVKEPYARVSVVPITAMRGR